MESGHPSPASASWKRDGAEVVLELSGTWLRENPPPEVQGDPPEGAPDRYETGQLESYDSTLPAFLVAQIRKPGQAPPEEDEADDSAEDQLPSLEGLPDDLRGLMELALAVPERSEAKSKPEHRSFLHRLGTGLLSTRESLESLCEFVGLTLLSLFRFVTGRARFRGRDFWTLLQETGVEALPIVSLISFLIGIILAFVGNVQLANFGASIFVADLVGIAMVREMGVVMTGIIMSGRTGAAFAANLGSMKANEEIDALRTFGFNAFDFLVLPRVLALVLMMPLLTIYSNVVGILGGMLIGMTADIPPSLYWQQTIHAITLTTASLGVFKSVFFGAAIAISGCLQGMNAGNSSAAVGDATTRAVVASITSVIVIDSAFAALFTVLGI